MNTVMDDNKMLTLVSNERIPLSDSMRMVFEIHSLRNATPATVSRAGILFINDTDIGHTPLVHTWLLRKSNYPDIEELRQLFEVRLPLLIDFCRQAKVDTVVPLPTINLVQSLCYIFEGMLNAFGGEKSASVYQRMFSFASIWSFGGALSFDKLTDLRKPFSSYIRELLPEVNFPDDGLVMDYRIDVATGAATPWLSRDEVDDGALQLDMVNAQVFVPTLDSTRLSFLLDILVRNGNPVMFVGSGGTGKTVLVNDYLTSLSSLDDKYKSITINMNYFTDSFSLQTMLEQSIDKRSGKTYGPPSGKMIFFVDDLNLPCVETYGTQTPMALMRQHMDYSSWYDRSEIGLKRTLVDCQYIASMNHKNGSFMIDPRLQRHFVTLSTNLPGDNELNAIFNTILESHLYHFDKKIHTLSQKIIESTTAVHKEIQLKFLPSAVKFFYNFTMRELSSVVRGLLNSKPHSFKEPKDIARLWYHEVMRVYTDRMMSEAEILRCREIVVFGAKSFYDDNSMSGAMDPFVEPCVFTNFVTKDSQGGASYVACEDGGSLKAVIESQLLEYNESNPIMNLVLFEQAMHQICRISRIMFNGGSALFCGVGGSGKQSLSKLACFISKFHFAQLTITNDYKLAAFKEDLRSLFQRAAIKPAEPIMFLLNDDQIIDERFLVCINDLLSTGRIADLFTSEEYDNIFAQLRTAAKGEGIPDNRDSMMKFFTQRIKANLHVVLCFSPVHNPIYCFRILEF